MVRLPVGDWTLQPYGPYKGCMDGVVEKIDWVFDTCAKYNVSILLDVHGMKDSQNSFDNSVILFYDCNNLFNKFLIESYCM